MNPVERNIINSAEKIFMNSVELSGNVLETPMGYPVVGTKLNYITEFEISTEERGHIYCVAHNEVSEHICDNYMKTDPIHVKGVIAGSKWVDPETNKTLSKTYLLVKQVL